MIKVSDDEFVKLWQSASSRNEVAGTASISGAAAGMRAQKLRERGVKLKKFSRGRPRKVVDVDALNELINKSA